MLSKTVIIETNLSENSAMKTIYDNLKPKKGLFSRNIITILSSSKSLHGVVNMPAPISDPFKNHVHIKAVKNNNFSTLKVKLHFGVINTLLILLFPALIIYLSGGLSKIELESMLIGFGFSLFIYIILQIKLDWEVKRITNWIIDDCKISKLNK